MHAAPLTRGFLFERAFPATTALGDAYLLINLISKCYDIGRSQNDRFTEREARDACFSSVAQPLLQPRGYTMKKAKAMREPASDNAISARFADHEIIHLERIFRSMYWENLDFDSKPYWLERVEQLRAEPLLVPQQRARLNSLLAGLNAEVMAAR
jgi:hypothetical protein